MNSTAQLSLFADAPEVEAIISVVHEILASRAQPSAWELLTELDRKLGLKARWAVDDAMQRLVADQFGLCHGVGRLAECKTRR